jgi:hypothetical protein
LRYSRNGHCLHWLSRGRCNASICRESSRPWMDHVTGWIASNGKRLLLCQPYALSEQSLQNLIEATTAFNLDAKIDGDGWYGFGTIAIELTVKENDHEH